MKTNAGTLAAPWPYFGGKSGACEIVWALLGEPDNYVEPFCGSAGEHDDLLAAGWTEHKWLARKGYALTDEAIENSQSETVWASPYCVEQIASQFDLFAQPSIEQAV